MKARVLSASILAFLLLLASSRALTVNSQPSPADSLDTPWSIPAVPDALTRAPLEDAYVAFWTDFLTPVPDSLPPDLLPAVAEAFSRTAFLTTNDYRHVLDRFPSRATLPAPWSAAAALLADQAKASPAAARHAAALDSVSPPYAPDDWRTPLAVLIAANALDNTTPRSASAQRIALRKRAADAAVALLRARPPEGLEGRIVFKILNNSPAREVVPGLNGNSRGSDLLTPALDSAGLTNAVTHLLRANAFLDAAFAARGTAWARDVPPEDMAAFHDLSAHAAAEARAAHDLAPDWPEPYLVLIDTAGSAHVPPVSIKRLFLAAVARQIDFFPVYRALFHYSMPRWSGSAAAPVLALRAFLSLGRFDVRTPYECVELYDAIASDQADMPDRYAALGLNIPLDLHPSLWPLLERNLVGCLDASPRLVPAERLVDSFVRHAARAKAPAAAIDALDRSGVALSFDNRFYHNEEDLACGPGGLPRLRLEAAIQHLVPSALANLERAFYRNNATALLNAATAISNALPHVTPAPAPDVFDRVATRVSRDVSILRDWEPESDWQPLFPRSKFVSRTDGRWGDLATGGLRGWSFDSTLFAIQWNQTCTDAAADFVLDTAPAGVDDPSVSMVLRLDTHRFVALTYYPASATIECAAVTSTHGATILGRVPVPIDPAPQFIRTRATPKGGYPKTTPNDLPPGTPNILRLRLRCVDSHVSAWVDGIPVFESLPAPEIPSDAAFSFAVGSFSPHAGYLLDIERLRFR